MGLLEQQLASGLLNQPATANPNMLAQALKARNQPRKQLTGQGLLDTAAIGLSPVPVIGDAIGLAADASRFYNEPESRTPLNFGLAALGALPFIPPLVSAGLGKFAQSQGKQLAQMPTGPARNQAGAIVYHGSPHKFDQFDSSKIGTGEGAQAYGHGLYFAESPDVASGYRDKLSKTVKVDGSELTSIPSDGPLAQARNMVVTSIQNGMTPDQAIAHTSKYWSDAASEMSAFKKSHPELASRIDQEVASRKSISELASSLKPDSFYKVPGSLYKVDLPDEAIAKMLDWDKPLSQQAPEVQKAIADYVTLSGKEHYIPKGENVPVIVGEGISGDTYGQQFYKWLSSNKAAGADNLRWSGIPGIRYLDGGSRGAGQGTSNYVVFPGNEGLLKILERQ